MRVFERLVAALRGALPAPAEALVQMRGGYQLSLRPATDALERRMYNARTYEAATLALFDQVLRAGDAVVDVGANLGLMTLHAARIVGSTGRVVALEPHPVYYARLVEHLILNSCDNVRALQVAAGATRASAPIYDFPAVNIGRSSLVSPGADAKPASTVAVDTLDSILAGIGVGRVRLLKVDVEGFEAQVLAGASGVLSQRPVICMEVSRTVSSGTDPLGAHDAIMDTGAYTAWNFRDGKGRPSPLVAVADRQRLAAQEDDNVIYIPHTERNSLPTGLFADD
ncbi:MAG: FkbM family methyltransferase [Xanthomonadaceae bacterium]|nr:FkbM family methyltransferase [Xanthomonadaceae bacterium]